MRYTRKIHPIVLLLRQRRRELGIPPKQLAASLGYCPQILREWERGAKVPRFTSLTDWCDALGVTLTIEERK